MKIRLNEDYYFIYNCLNTLEVETYNNRRGQLGYECFSVRIKNTPDLIAKEVSIHAFR